MNKQVIDSTRGAQDDSGWKKSLSTLFSSMFLRTDVMLLISDQLYSPAYMSLGRLDISKPILGLQYYNFSLGMKKKLFQFQFYSYVRYIF